ncbi:hypothetical protein SFB21_0578 [Acinetobacter bouvetii]|uniref:Uncharacterized protein n=1 Tax=Acinetobacter bouvetii TaxID=202951 RepID=A0A811G9F0_9GAMM|nr:hypothetical protein SFB21_0578 [Acinetobacter bouvetii]
MWHFLTSVQLYHPAQDIDYRIGMEFDKMRQCFLDVR